MAAANGDPPPLWHPLKATPSGPTSLGHLGALHGEEVDDTGGEVERGQGLALQHAHTVPVAIAGPRHPPAEDDEGVPGWDEAASVRPCRTSYPHPQCPSPAPGCATGTYPDSQVRQRILLMALQGNGPEMNH